MTNDVSIITFLIVCPLVALAGFVDSIAGGGGLISLPAYLIAGVPPITASATNKLSAFMGATVSLGNYARKGFVKLKLAIPTCVVAVGFSSLGAKLQTLIPEYYLKIFMLIALPVTLIFILNKKSLEPKNDGIIEIGLKEILFSLFIAMVMGIYDGLYGPGTGTFLLIFFVNIVKMNIRDSNGISKAINWATNCGSLIYFFRSGLPIFTLGIIAGCCNMLGCYIGSTLFVKKGVHITRPIMIIVMLIFIVKILLEFVL